MAGLAAMLAALLGSLCLGDRGSLLLLCALCTWLNVLCVVLSMRITGLIVAEDIFGYVVWIRTLRACMGSMLGEILFFLW